MFARAHWRPWAMRFTIALVTAVCLTGCGHQKNRAAPAAVVDAPPLEDRLGVDDIVEIKVFGEAELSGLFRVSPIGTMDYPLAGRIHVAGLRLDELQSTLVNKLKPGYLKDPQVSVTINHWNSRKVSVLGQVQKPGAVEFFPNMTIVDAIVQAGGFTPIADKNNVNLRREISGKVETTTFPVADISEGRHANVPVLPGDVIVVGERLF